MITGEEIIELISCESGFSEWCDVCPERREIPSPKEDGLAVEPVDYTCPCEFDVESKDCVKSDILKAVRDAADALAEELERGTLE